MMYKLGLLEICKAPHTIFSANVVILCLPFCSSVMQKHHNNVNFKLNTIHTLQKFRSCQIHEIRVRTMLAKNSTNPKRIISHFRVVVLSYDNRDIHSRNWFPYSSCPVVSSCFEELYIAANRCIRTTEYNTVVSHNWPKWSLMTKSFSYLSAFLVSRSSLSLFSCSVSLCSLYRIQTFAPITVFNLIYQ